MPKENRERVAKAAGLLMVAILISRILGFLRERAIAEVFGRTGTTDVFFAAFAIPDLMYQLLVGGVLSSAFIPVFTQYLALDQEEEAWHVASVFWNFTVLALLALMIGGIIFAPVLAPLVGMGFSGSQKELLVLLMRVTFPAVFFTALSGLAMGLLNSYQEFTLPAVGPIIYNLGQILGAYFLGPILGIFGVAAGTVTGALGSFSIQLPAVVRKAKNYRFSFDWRHPGILRMMRLMLPAVLGLSIAQINIIISQNLASTLETGSIVALRLANRLINFPLGIFAMGISIAIFPTLSGLVARGELAEFRRTLVFGLRVVLFITIPASVGMVFLRLPIVRLLFESGEFTSADSLATAFALLFYAPGLLAQAVVQVTTRGYYSLQDTITPVKIGFFTVVANVLFSLAFLRWTNLGHGGLALAFSLSSLLNMLAALLILRKRMGGLEGRALLQTGLKAALASLIMGVAVSFSSKYLGAVLDNSSKFGQLVQTMGALTLGILVYVILSVALRMEETIFVWNLIKERLGVATGRKEEKG